MKFILAITNMKGGVGKTTLALNLAYRLAQYEHVCIVDIDPQIHSLKFFVDEESILAYETKLKDVLEILLKEDGLYDEIPENVKDKVFSSIISYRPENVKKFIHFPVSSPEIEIIEDKLRVNIFSVSSLFKRYFQILQEQFPIIIVDCPPSLSRVTVQSALCGCDYLLIPTDPSYFSVSSIDFVFNIWKRIKANNNPSLEILGIILTLYRKNQQLSETIREELKLRYGELFWEDLCIPLLADFQKSIVMQKDVCSYRRNGKACKIIEKLTKKILNEVKKNESQR